MIMGNDEFILYIRKHFPTCSLSTIELGHRISMSIKDLDSNAHIIQPDEPCYWGQEGDFISEKKLPKTAAQISFNSRILPELFCYLDDLGLNS